DVARHVVDAERTLALRKRSARDALPELVELTDDHVLRLAVCARVEPPPRLVDEAGVDVAVVAVRIRQRLLALAREGPLVLRTQSLAALLTEPLRLVPVDVDDRVLALPVRILEPVDA